jgi:hypothetical protein
VNANWYQQAGRYGEASLRLVRVNANWYQQAGRYGEASFENCTGERKLVSVEIEQTNKEE